MLIESPDISDVYDILVSVYSIVSSFDLSVFVDYQTSPLYGSIAGICVGFFLVKAILYY